MDPHRLVYSAILGAVDLVDCRPHDGGWAWKLPEPRPLPAPVWCKGALSLWTPPADLWRAVR